MPKSTPTVPAPREPLCRDGLLPLYPDAAAFLGGISRSKIFDMVRRGVLPTVRVDNGPRKIPKRALVEYAEALLVGREGGA